jgi:hypothetical protein
MVISTGLQILYSFLYRKYINQTGGRNRTCARAWYQWEGGACGKRVEEGEYGVNTLYT